MFDDQPKVVDMFDVSEKPAVPRPTAPPSPLIPTPPASAPVLPPPLEPIAPHTSSLRIAKGVVLLAFVLALIGGAGYAAWRLMSQEPSNNGPVRSVNDNGIVAPEDDTEPSEDPEDSKEEPAQPAARSTFLDSDGDGLTNAEELEAGTGVNEADTDSDGLGDREEVKVYGTNPRKADTDGDTFLDGQEVAGGYNPNGEGKLFNIPTE